MYLHVIIYMKNYPHWPRLTCSSKFGSSITFVWRKYACHHKFLECSRWQQTFNLVLHNSLVWSKYTCDHKFVECNLVNKFNLFESRVHFSRQFWIVHCIIHTPKVRLHAKTVKKLSQQCFLLLWLQEKMRSNIAPYVCFRFVFLSFGACIQSAEVPNGSVCPCNLTTPRPLPFLVAIMDCWHSCSIWRLADRIESGVISPLSSGSFYPLPKHTAISWSTGISSCWYWLL